MAIIKARSVEEYVCRVRRTDFETEELFEYALEVESK